jgi:methyl-accepting chemotaxis protein
MMTIRNKLYIGFALILAFSIGQAAVTYLNLNQSEALVNQAIGKDFNASVEIARIGIEAQKLRRFEKEFLIYVGSKDQRAKYFTEWKGAHDQVKTMLDRIVENRDADWSAGDIAKAREWQVSLKGYADGFTGVVLGADSGQITSTMQGNEAVREAKDAFRVLLDGTTMGVEQKYKQAVASEQAIGGKFRLVNIVIGIAALAGIGLVAVMLVIVPNSISRPIEVLTRSAHDMSTGIMSKPVAVAGSPEFKELADTLERMRVSQQMLIERLKKK